MIYFHRVEQRFVGQPSRFLPFGSICKQKQQVTEYGFNIGGRSFLL